MKREKIEEGKVIKKKEEVSLILLVIIVFPATCEKSTVLAVCRGRPRSDTGTNPSRAVTKSCTVSTICDSDPTHVRGDTLTLSKL